MTQTVIFWKQRILEYLVARSRHIVYRTSFEREMERQYSRFIDDNYHLALQELRDEEILYERNMGGYLETSLYIIQKKDKIRYYLRMTPNDVRAEIIQPSSKELKGLKIIFDSSSERKYPNQGIYYYCKKIKDPTFWVVLIKHSPIKKATKVILGSNLDDSSRISKIKRATKLVSRLNNHKDFVRKKVEDIEQAACGNNRIPSKCAFDVFVHEGFLEITGQKGLSKKFRLATIEKKTDIDDKGQ